MPAIPLFSETLYLASSGSSITYWSPFPQTVPGTQDLSLKPLIFSQSQEGEECLTGGYIICSYQHCSQMNISESETEGIDCSLRGRWLVASADAYSAWRAPLADGTQGNGWSCIERPRTFRQIKPRCSTNEGDRVEGSVSLLTASKTTIALRPCQQHYLLGLYTHRGQW